MALGSKKRDFKTEDRRIRKTLAKHFKRMNEYISQGIPKEKASKKAFEDISKKAFEDLRN